FFAIEKSTMSLYHSFWFRQFCSQLIGLFWPVSGFTKEAWHHLHDQTIRIALNKQREGATSIGHLYYSLSLSTAINVLIPRPMEESTHEQNNYNKQ
ncbi:MAG: hypothetical protein P8016_16220, partial [Sedimentisphaerales bacterium]